MNRKIAKVLAATAALALTGVAAAQDTTAETSNFLTDLLGNFDFSLTSIGGIIGPVAGIILFLLFARFGGFRWLY